MIKYKIEYPKTKRKLCSHCCIEVAKNKITEHKQHCILKRNNLRKVIKYLLNNLNKKIYLNDIEQFLILNNICTLRSFSLLLFNSDDFSLNKTLVYIITSAYEKKIVTDKNYELLDLYITRILFNDSYGMEYKKIKQKISAISNIPENVLVNNYLLLINAIVKQAKDDSENTQLEKDVVDDANSFLNYMFNKDL